MIAEQIAPTLNARLTEILPTAEVWTLTSDDDDPDGQTWLFAYPYDVWRLIESGVAARAAADVVLFEQVAAHRKVYFRRGWVNYDTLKRGTIQMGPQPEQIDEWRRDYAAMQGEMFLGVPPAFDEILTRIASFQADFNAG